MAHAEEISFGSPEKSKHTYVLRITSWFGSPLLTLRLSSWRRPVPHPPIAVLPPTHTHRFPFFGCAPCQPVALRQHRHGLFPFLLELAGKTVAQSAALREATEFPSAHIRSRIKLSLKMIFFVSSFRVRYRCPLKRCFVWVLSHASCYLFLLCATSPHP
jgi:hypothetical protein